MVECTLKAYYMHNTPSYQCREVTDFSLHSAEFLKHETKYESSNAYELF